MSNEIPDRYSDRVSGTTGIFVHDDEIKAKVFDLDGSPTDIVIHFGRYNEYTVFLSQSKAQELHTRLGHALMDFDHLVDMGLEHVGVQMTEAEEA